MPKAIDFSDRKHWRPVLAAVARLVMEQERRGTFLATQVERDRDLVARFIGAVTRPAPAGGPADA